MGSEAFAHFLPGRRVISIEQESKQRTDVPMAHIEPRVPVSEPEYSNFGEGGAAFVDLSAASHRMPTTKHSVTFEIFQTTGEISAEAAPFDVDIR